MLFKYYIEERELEYCLYGKEHCSVLRNINSVDAYEFYKTISEHNDFETTIKFYEKREDEM